MNNKAEKLLLEELDKYKIFGECGWNREYYIPPKFMTDVITFENGKIKKTTEKMKPIKGRKGSIRIDAVIKCGSQVTYIVEVKQKLNYKAFGQVFFYEYVYKEDSAHPEEKTRKVIVCKEVADVVRNVCMSNDIDVIEITDKDIKMNGKIIKKKKTDFINSKI